MMSASTRAWFQHTRELRQLGRKWICRWRCNYALQVALVLMNAYFIGSGDLSAWGLINVMAIAVSLWGISVCMRQISEWRARLAVLVWASHQGRRLYRLPNQRALHVMICLLKHGGLK